MKQDLREALPKVRNGGLVKRVPVSKFLLSPYFNIAIWCPASKIMLSHNFWIDFCL